MAIWSAEKTASGIDDFVLQTPVHGKSALRFSVLIVLRIFTFLRVFHVL